MNPKPKVRRMELYDIVADPSELNNLAEKHPIWLRGVGPALCPVRKGQQRRPGS
jgi:hypothetical protein